METGTAGGLRLPPAKKLQTRRPNPEGLATLIGAYAALGPKNGKRPWTREECLHLGRLFLLAWGEYPSYSKLRKHYCMPDKQAILNLFGSRPAYWDAIREYVQ